ncbi:MAG: zinc ribbon domain-containing protein [Thermogemmatispora sp.]|uniref:zinc ribbon domain-containing protein n=1 Tax=Thermogemmatispora sp. TaxID=1968838 RepID=UPI002630C732|nr:zinc ribbon domain-containing protein [Thermogemmatispora sp.]MBX5457662.1 zinc ribbon domain-containing protein [Thermogemmatispora sp.]
MLCTHCGTANIEEASYCQQCGQPLPAATPASTTTPPTAVASESEQTPSSSAIQEVANRADRKLPSEATPSRQSQPPASLTSGTGTGTPRPPAGSATTARSQMVSGPARTQPEWPLRTLVAHGIMPLRRDQASMVMIGGCAACLLGFFLPWIELQGFEPLLPSQFAVSGAQIGLMTWLPFLALILQATLLVGEPWLLKNNPRLIVWLPALPLITGAFALAIAVYTLGICFRLEGLLSFEDLLGTSPANAELAIVAGPGAYLTLISSLIVLAAGSYRLVQLLLRARFSQ